jgi:hypothetical protein
MALSGGTKITAFDVNQKAVATLNEEVADAGNNFSSHILGSLAAIAYNLKRAMTIITNKTA